jgi:hypothetical protein
MPTMCIDFNYISIPYICQGQKGFEFIHSVPLPVHLEGAKAMRIKNLLKSKLSAGVNVNIADAKTYRTEQ